jgi:amino acid transporter
MINLIIGAGIFGLPAAAFSILGRQSPTAYLCAAAGMAVIAACVAEVASRFGEAGGPYLYARVAFGRLAGLQTGWLLALTRLTSAAAVANVFLDYLAGAFPSVQRLPIRLAVLTMLVGGLAVINIRDITMGTRVSNVFMVAKVVPLCVFVCAGLAFAYFHPLRPLASRAYPAESWLSAVLLLIYAFSGFESALIAAGEVKSPGRDVPAALMAALPAVAVLYFLVQVVVIHSLANPGDTVRPLAAAALVVGGRSAGSMLATMMNMGALLSTFGSLAANMIANPRITFALAVHEDFPKVFAVVHPRYRTPYVSIGVFAVLLWVLAAVGTFRWNAALSAVSRLCAYAITCAALPVLRRTQPGQESFHLPCGSVFAMVGLTFAVVLASRMGWAEVVALAVTASVAGLNWMLVRRNS